MTDQTYLSFLGPCIYNEVRALSGLLHLKLLKGVGEEKWICIYYFILADYLLAELYVSLVYISYIFPYQSKLYSS